MRVVLVVVGAVVLVALGVVQSIATALVRDSAEPGSWARLVPAAVGERVAQLDPGLPFPPAFRLLLARKALEARDFARAQLLIAGLAPSRDRAALEGRLAEERGDETAAVKAYLEAGDLSGLERRVDRLDAQGDVEGALTLQRATVARLANDRTQADALAQAYWRLGRLEQSAAYKLPSDSIVRSDQELRSYQAYANAVALAPFAERYLIAAGNQELNLGDLVRAKEYFTRALQADPSSALALVGFGDVALRSGDQAGAHMWLARAQRIAPGTDAVNRLAQKLGE